MWGLRGMSRRFVDRLVELGACLVRRGLLRRLISPNFLAKTPIVYFHHFRIMLAYSCHYLFPLAWSRSIHIINAVRAAACGRSSFRSIDPLSDTMVKRASCETLVVGITIPITKWLPLVVQALSPLVTVWEQRTTNAVTYTNGMTPDVNVGSRARLIRQSFNAPRALSQLVLTIL